MYSRHTRNYLETEILYLRTYNIIGHSVVLKGFEVKF
jgi:hypothetical protein